MVFNFWHFLPKLGHLVLKQKKIPVFKKKPNSVFDSHAMHCIEDFGDKLGLRGIKFNSQYRKFGSPQPNPTCSCKKVCSRKCPKVAKIAKAKITRFLKKLFDSYEDFGDKQGLGISRSWRCQDNQSGPKREGIIQLLLIFCTDQVIQF